MPRTTISPEVIPTNTPLTEEVVVWVAADASNGNQFAHTGRETLLVWNSGAGARTFTPTSVAVNGRQDPKNGVAQSIGAGLLRVYNFRGEGWKQSDGYVYIDAEHAEVKYIVFQHPA